MARCMCLAMAVVLHFGSVASACPGSMFLGLPLIFGPDEPATSWPVRMAADAAPVINLPKGLEEAQEHRDPPSRKEQAQESLKVWRQLVREGRFSAAAVVAAKAAALDPTNIDVQQAVMVSHVLRNVGEQTKTPSISVSTACCETRSPECPLSMTAECALKHMFPNGLLAGGQKTKTCTCKKNGEKAIGEVKSETTEIDRRAGVALKRLFPGNIVEGANAPEIRLASFEVRPLKERVTIKTANWQIECDRVAQPSDREMILEGNVTMRQRDISVAAGRVRLNLIDGTFQIAP